MTTHADDSAQLSPTAFIARSILSFGLSGRLPVTTWYQEVLGIGSGTVQKALQELKKSGAVKLVSRGHQGTYVVSWNFALLWSAARMPPVHMLLPPRGSQEATIVASAFAKQCKGWGIATTVSYLRGARSRITALEQNIVDIALLSSGSAQVLLADATAHGYEFFNVGDGSYYHPESLVVVEAAQTTSTGPLRVGIDFHSSDHQRLTRAQFPETEYIYVVVDFTQLPRSVFLGEIDTGVWHQEPSLIPLDKVGLNIRPLNTPKALALATEISSAVLMVKADSPVAQLLRQIDVAELYRLASIPYEADNPYINGALLSFRLDL